jgi:hypothetical protein
LLGDKDTSFYASQLLNFSVKLLNFPTDITHLLYGIRGILSFVVGSDKFRLVGGDND